MVIDLQKHNLLQISTHSFNEDKKISTVAQFSSRIIRHFQWRIEHARKRQEQLPHLLAKSYFLARLGKYKLPEITLSSLVPVEVETKPLIMDDICLPPYVFYNDHDDAVPIMQLVVSQKPAVVLELGTAHGNTTANICNQSEQTHVYTVNAPVEEQTGEIITYELTRDEVGRVYKNHNFATRVTQIMKNTLHLNLSEYFDRPCIDIAIIDACHDTSYVISDFHKVKDFVKPGGVVLFHDTDPTMDGHLMGSYVACMKLRKKGYDIRQLKNTWWGVWVKQAE